MTQTRLAELSGVSKATISYIKCGKSCSNEVGQKIAEALGVAVEEILED
jgi:Predicted transcriptional regulators